MKLKLAFIFLTALFFGCSEKVVINPEEDKKVVFAQIENFHKLYNEEKFNEIAETIYHPEFLNNEKREKMLYQYRNFYDKFGKITKVNSISDIKYFTGGVYPHRYAIFWYDVNYENGSNFSELFIISLPDEPKITTHRIHNELHMIEVFH